MAAAAASAAAKPPAAPASATVPAGNASSPPTAPQSTSSPSSTPIDLPQPAPLSADDPFLTSPHFDVDAFLVSRSHATPLSQISASLSEYRERLRRELEAVVDRDFRGFVELGTGIKAEAPRVARLAWHSHRHRRATRRTRGNGRRAEAARPTSANDAGGGQDEEGDYAYGQDSEDDEVDEHGEPHIVGGAQTGALGLNTVRSQVESAKDGLRELEGEIRTIMGYRDQAAKFKDQLSLLLDYDAAFCRLEAVLLIPKTHSGRGQTSTGGATSDVDGASTLTRLISLDDWDSDSSLGSEDADEATPAESFTSEDEAEDVVDVTGGAGMPGGVQAASAASAPTSKVERRSSYKRQSLSPVRSRNSLLLAAGAGYAGGSGHARRASAQPLHGFAAERRSTEELPVRIGRARAELHMLRYLQRRIARLELSQFTSSYAERAQVARRAILADLGHLLRALASLGGSSLLVSAGEDDKDGGAARVEGEEGTARAKVLPPTASELDTWSQVGLPPTSQEQMEAYVRRRREEQVAWFEMALRTCSELDQPDSLGAAPHGNEEGGNNGENVAMTATAAAEALLKECFVQPWIDKHIHAGMLQESHLNDPRRPPQSRKDNDAAEAPTIGNTSAPTTTQAKRSGAGAETTTTAKMAATTTTTVGAETVFDEILGFVRHEAGLLCRASERARVEAMTEATTIGGTEVAGDTGKPESPGDEERRDRGQGDAPTNSIVGATLQPRLVPHAREHEQRALQPRSTNPAHDERQLPRVDFFNNVLWDAVGGAVMDRLGGELFFVGRPEMFHRNYFASRRFLRQLESLAPSAASAATFASHPVRVAFERRWQLPVYFQIRLRDVVGSLETALAQPGNGVAAAAATFATTTAATNNRSVPDVGGGDGDGMPCLGGTRVCVKAFGAVWSDDTHVPELAARQWKLSLQVVNRYRTWLTNEVPPEATGRIGALGGGGGTSGGGSGAEWPPRRSGTPVRPQTPSQQPSRGSGEMQRSATSGLATAGATTMTGAASLGGSGGVGAGVGGVPSRVGTPNTAVEAEAALAHDEAQLRTLTLLAADAHWLERTLLATWRRDVVRRVEAWIREEHGGAAFVEEEWVATKRAMRDALLETCGFSRSLLPSISYRILSVLKARCCEPLRLVRSVSTTQQSRGGGGLAGTVASLGSAFQGGGVGGNGSGGTAPKPAPSYFVPQILRPLKAYLGRAEASTATTPARCLSAGLRRAWAEEVVEDVVLRYTAALHAMNRNLESLRRLKRGHGSSLGLGGMFGGGGVTTAGEEVGAAAANAPLDAQKLQMLADVAALEQDVRSLEFGMVRLGSGSEARGAVDEEADWEASESDAEVEAEQLGEQGGKSGKVAIAAPPLDTDTPAWSRLRAAAMGALGDE